MQRLTPPSRAPLISNDYTYVWCRSKLTSTLSGPWAVSAARYHSFRAYTSGHRYISLLASVELAYRHWASKHYWVWAASPLLLISEHGTGALVTFSSLRRKIDSGQTAAGRWIVGRDWIRNSRQQMGALTRGIAKTTVWFICRIFRVSSVPSKQIGLVRKRLGLKVEESTSL